MCFTRDMLSGRAKTIKFCVLEVINEITFHKVQKQHLEFQKRFSSFLAKIL